MKIQSLAKTHNIFTYHRATSECVDCQLFEDITFDGKLFVYHSKNFGKDTGLKFEELDNNALRCPGCGKVFCPYESMLVDFE